MKTILLTAFLLIALHSFSQNTFVVSMGTDLSTEQLNRVIETKNGKYISVGYSYIPGSKTNVYITCNDKNGVLLWSKIFARENSYSAVGDQIINTLDGGFVISSIIDYKSYVSKFDSAGTLLWTKRYDLYEVASLLQTDDGGFMISGSITPGGFGRKRDAYMLRTDSLGNVEWSKEFFLNTYYSDIVNIKKTFDGNYILLSIASNATFKGDTSYIIKVDTLGNILWSKYILSLNAATGAGGSYVLSTSDGGYLVSGSLYDINTAFITKLDNNGNFKWSKYFNSQSPYPFYGYNSIETSDGYITCGDGTTQSTNFFIFTKFNKAGDVVWIKTINKFYYTDYQALFYLIQTKDAGFLGIQANQIFYNDAVLMKFDMNFNSCFSEGTFGGWQDFGSIDSAKVIAINGNVSAYNDSAIVSSFGSYTSLCSTLPLKLISFTGALTSNTVNLQWKTASEINTKRFEIERSSDGVDFNTLQDVSASNKNNGITVYNAIDNKPLNGKSWYRLKIVDNDGTFVYSSILPITNLINNIINISPNPVGNVLNLNIESIVSSPIKVQIYDLNGKLLLQEALQVFQGDNIININVSNYSRGMYLIKLVQNTYVQNIRWLKQ